MPHPVLVTPHAEHRQAGRGRTERGRGNLQRQRDAPGFGEFHRVAEQISQDGPERLGVARHRARHVRRDDDIEVEPARRQ